MKERRYVVGCVGAIAFALAYAWWGPLGLPTLWYRPLEHRWAFSHGAGLAMGWYGHVAGAALVSAIAIAAAGVTLRRGAGPRAVSCASIALVVAHVLALVAVLR